MKLHIVPALCLLLGTGLITLAGELPKLPTAVELKKLPPDGGPKWNRLVFESSPYLLQHAANPVDWFPWGDEAFDKARVENKPVLLSIGYATCHWCHVMERESFADPEVAELLNRNFISIKVDREERPDLDELYMTAGQAISGRAGWPLTLMLDHQRRPWFAGTYFPKSGTLEKPGLMQIIPQMSDLWATGRDAANKFSLDLVEHLQGLYRYDAGPTPGRETLDKAFQQLNGRYDSARGGFGTAPKFPTPHNLNFLLRYWKRTGNIPALEMVRTTLKAMRDGGIYDHVGFGFHRYSVDHSWRVPHFEKMLYDQALLAIAYLECFQATGEEEFAQTAREIFTYVLRDMTSPQGAFYSAEDAESEGIEGKFYLWTYEEIMKIAGPEDGRVFCAFYNIYKEGNFKSDGFPGANIPYRGLPLEYWSKQNKLEPGEVRASLERARLKLFEIRKKRVHPFKDDKILTDWNGLMIAALAMGGRILDDAEYTNAARKATDFVLTKLRKDGRLLKRYRNGNAGMTAHLEDYSFMVWGLLELYQTTFDTGYLEESLSLTGDSINLFWDGENNGFFMTPADGEILLVRPKGLLDNAIPAGNSVAALNLVRLARLTANPLFEEKANELIKSFASRIDRAPSALCQMMQAIDFIEGPAFEVIVAGKADSPDTKSMLNALNGAFGPNKVILLRPPGGSPIVDLAPYTKEYKAKNGKATAYVCRNYTCKLPTNDIKIMLDHLGVKD